MISIYQKRCFQPLERSFPPIGRIASDGWKLRRHLVRRTDEQLNSFYFSIPNILTLNSSYIYNYNYIYN